MGILYGGSSCLLVKGGIASLSELVIDCAKDWGGHGISNLGGLAAGMIRGDLLAHNGTVMVTVSPNSVGNILTSHGPGHQVGFETPPS